MPTILRDGPYRLFFYSNEGEEPPHVHVERDRGRVTAKARADWRLIGDGEGVHWPRIDEDVSVAGLLRAG